MKLDKIKVTYEFSQQTDAAQREDIIQDIKDILKNALFEYLEKIPKSAGTKEASRTAFCRKGEAR